MTKKATMPERQLVDTPVPVVLPGRLAVSSLSGTVEIPIAVSRDWTVKQNNVTRAVIIIHGWPRRDLVSGEHAAEVAGAASKDALIVTPQFLTENDIAAHHLPADMLGWGVNDWPKGKPSDDRATVSSFQVIDEIFKRLADRAIFPNLRMIVLAGHSAGGQFVQRYAAVGQGEALIADTPIHVRYVVANPSTYLYVTDDRAVASSTFAPFDAGSCPTFNRWNYGMQTEVPPYVSSQRSAAQWEADYLKRDVVYLLGTEDDAADADGLDRSCGAEAQGPTRYARGLAFDVYIHHLDPNTPQHLLKVPGVAHSSYRMFASACGLAALFDKQSCEQNSR